MTIFWWFAAFLAATVFEASLLPRFFGGFMPTIGDAVLILGVAYQRFWPGFLFSGASGLLRDIEAGGGANSLMAVGIFLAIRVFAAFTKWEDPLGRIGAVASALLLKPLILSAAIRLTAIIPGAAVAGPAAYDIVHAVLLGDILFGVLWFSTFSWFEIKRVARRQTVRLRHI